MATTTAPAGPAGGQRRRFGPPGRFRRPLSLRLPDSLSALAERDFRVIWTGQAISMTGTWMQMIAQGLLVLELWNNPFALGAVNFANAAPSLVIMLFGGVLADRADKRRILLNTQIVMGLLAAAVGALILTDTVQYWMIIAATMALGIAFGYDMPAYQALLPELVPPEKIGQVVALNSSTFHGTRMVGPAIAGAIIAAFGLAVAYFLNALSFVAVIISLLIIHYRPRPRSGDHHGSALDGLRQGIRHVRRRPNVQAMLLLTGLSTTFVFPIIAVLTPFYVKDTLHQGPGTLGLLWGGSGVGSMIGALALIWWGQTWRGARIWFAAIIAPAGLIIMAFTREPLVALAVQPFVSYAFSSQLGLFQMMMQESTPDDFRGRVMSLNGITFNGTMPLAALAFSGLAVGIGLPAVMIIAAIAYLATATAALRFSGGGIDAVVERSRAEFDVIASQIRPA